MDFDPAAPRAYLSVRFVPDSDGTGELWVEAAAGGFAGHGAAWFDATRLAQFADSLTAFPLPEEGLSLASGFWSRDQRGELEQEHVGLAFRKVGRRGQVGVGIHLSGERWADTRPESVPDVRMELHTTYERLRQFSSDLGAAVKGTLHEAVLLEELLA